MLDGRGEEKRNPHEPPASLSRLAARPTGCEATVRALVNLLCPLGSIRAIMLATVVFGGCSMLAPKQDRTRFIVLTSTTPGSLNSPRSAANPALTSAAIGLGPIQLPEYLDRPELLIRTSPNEFELSERDRWAETLTENFRHVLANDLINLLGTTNIVQYPWYPGTRLDYVVQIQVQHFEARTNQTAELAAHWELRTPPTEQLLASREAQFSRRLTSLTGDAAAAGLSQDVAALATQIALTIMQAEQQRLARGPH